MIDLAGVLIPTTTPFDPVTGELDPVALRANVRHWMETGVRGVVLGGSTGEAVLQTVDERLLAVGSARDVVPDDRLLVVGTGCEATRATVFLTEEAARRGADAVLVQPPAFYRTAMSPGVLRDHYGEVADRSPVPVLLYQVPLKMSTVEFPAGLVGELARHPNIVGMKDSRGDMNKLGELARQVPDDFQLLVGSGARVFAALELGAVGGILGVANLVPDESAGIVAAYRAGDPGRAGRLQGLVGPLHDGIVGGFGVAGVKAALDRLGLHGGAPRPPLAPLGDADRAQVEALLSEAGISDAGVAEAGVSDAGVAEAEVTE